MTPLAEALADIPPEQLRNYGLYAERRPAGVTILLLRNDFDRREEWLVGRAASTAELISVVGALEAEMKAARASANALADAGSPRRPRPRETRKPPARAPAKRTQRKQGGTRE